MIYVQISISRACIYESRDPCWGGFIDVIYCKCFVFLNFLCFVF